MNVLSKNNQNWRHGSRFIKWKLSDLKKKRWFKQRIKELSYGAGPNPPYFLQIGDKEKNKSENPDVLIKQQTDTKHKTRNSINDGRASCLFLSGCYRYQKGS